MDESILSLPDECLENIFSFVDDPFTFGSIALTCKRFLRLTENDGRVVHTNLLKSKAEYYIKLWTAHSRRRLVDGKDRLFDDIYDIGDLLRECATLTASKNAVTHDKVMAVWERNGPVAAKLFTWVRDLKCTVYSSLPTEMRNVTLHLPKCKKNVIIRASLNRESTVSCYPNLSINCGDTSVEASSHSDASGPLDNFIHWTKEEVERATEPMKSVIELLQEELGETIPPVTPYFFLWLCFFFPDKSDLLDDNRLCFKDASRNMKPTRTSVNMVITDYNRELRFKDSLQEMFGKWKSVMLQRNSKMRASEQLLQKIPKKIEETLPLLSLRSEAKVLEQLKEHRFKFHLIADYCAPLQDLDNEVIFDLFSRTSLEKSSTYKSCNAIPIKHFENLVMYRCIGGKYMKVWGAMHGDGRRSWEKIELEFTLPDDKVLKLESPFNLQILSPVTDILQEGINNDIYYSSLTEQGYSQRIDNFHTANYFVKALDLNVASEIAFHPWDRPAPRVFARNYSMLEEDHEWSSDESLWSLHRFPESEEENE